MSRQAGRKRSENLSLAMFLGLAIGGPVVLGKGGVTPEWFGAAVGGAGLLGALIVLSSQGAAKMGYVLLLIGAVAAAALAGMYLA